MVDVPKYYGDSDAPDASDVSQPDVPDAPAPASNSGLVVPKYYGNSKMSGAPATHSGIVVPKYYGDSKMSGAPAPQQQAQPTSYGTIQNPDDIQPRQYATDPSMITIGKVRDTRENFRADYENHVQTMGAQNGSLAFKAKYKLSPKIDLAPLLSTHDEYVQYIKPQWQAQMAQENSKGEEAVRSNNRWDVGIGFLQGISRGATFGLLDPTNNTRLNKAMGMNAGSFDASGNAEGASTVTGKITSAVAEMATGILINPESALAGTVRSAQLVKVLVEGGESAEDAVRIAKAAVKSGEIISKLETAGVKGSALARAALALPRAEEAIGKLGTAGRIVGRVLLGAARAEIYNIPYSLGQNLHETGRLFGPGWSDTLVENAKNPATWGTGAAVESVAGGFHDIVGALKARGASGAPHATDTPINTDPKEYQDWAAQHPNTGVDAMASSQVMPEHPAQLALPAPSPETVRNGERRRNKEGVIVLPNRGDNVSVVAGGPVREDYDKLYIPKYSTRDEPGVTPASPMNTRPTDEQVLGTVPVVTLPDVKQNKQNRLQDLRQAMSPKTASRVQQAIMKDSIAPLIDAARAMQKRGEQGVSPIQKSVESALSKVASDTNNKSAPTIASVLKAIDPSTTPEDEKLILEHAKEMMAAQDITWQHVYEDLHNNGVDEPHAWYIVKALGGEIPHEAPELYERIGTINRVLAGLHKVPDKPIRQLTIQEGRLHDSQFGEQSGDFTDPVDEKTVAFHEDALYGRLKDSDRRDYTDNEKRVMARSLARSSARNGFGDAPGIDELSPEATEWKKSKHSVNESLQPEHHTILEELNGFSHPINGPKETLKGDSLQDDKHYQTAAAKQGATVRDLLRGHAVDISNHLNVNKNQFGNEESPMGFSRESAREQIYDETSDAMANAGFDREEVSDTLKKAPKYQRVSKKTGLDAMASNPVSVATASNPVSVAPSDTPTEAPLPKGVSRGLAYVPSAYDLSKIPENIRLSLGDSVKVTRELAIRFRSYMDNGMEGFRDLKANVQREFGAHLKNYAIEMQNAYEMARANPEDFRPKQNASPLASAQPTGATGSSPSGAADPFVSGSAAAGPAPTATSGDIPTHTLPQTTKRFHEPEQTGWQKTKAAIRKNGQLVTALVNRYDEGNPDSPLRVGFDRLAAARDYGENLSNRAFTDMASAMGAKPGKPIQVGGNAYLKLRDGAPIDDATLFVLRGVMRMSEEAKANWEEEHPEEAMPTNMQDTYNLSHSLTADHVQRITNEPGIVKAGDINYAHNERVRPEREAIGMKPGRGGMDQRYQVSTPDFRSWRDWLSHERLGKSYLAGRHQLATILANANNDSSDDISSIREALPGGKFDKLEQILELAPQNIKNANNMTLGDMERVYDTASKHDFTGGAMGYSLDLHDTVTNRVGLDFHNAALKNLHQVLIDTGVGSRSDITRGASIESSVGATSRRLDSIATSLHISNDEAKNLLTDMSMSVPGAGDKVGELRRQQAGDDLLRIADEDLKNERGAQRRLYVPEDVAHTLESILFRASHPDQYKIHGVTTALNGITQFSMSAWSAPTIAHYVRLVSGLANVGYGDTPTGKMAEHVISMSMPYVGRMLTASVKMLKVAKQIKAGDLSDPLVKEIQASHEFFAMEGRGHVNPISDLVVRPEDNSLGGKILNGMDRISKYYGVPQLRKFVFEDVDPMVRAIHDVYLQRAYPGITKAQRLDAADGFGIYCKGLLGEIPYMAKQSGAVPFAGYRAGAMPAQVSSLTGSQGYSGTPLGERALNISILTMAPIVGASVYSLVKYGKLPQQMGFKAYEYPVEIGDKIVGINSLAFNPLAAQAINLVGGGEARNQDKGENTAWDALGNPGQAALNFGLRAVESPVTSAGLTAFANVRPSLTPNMSYVRAVRSSVAKDHMFPSQVLAGTLQLAPQIDAVVSAAAPDWLGIADDDRWRGLGDLTGVHINSGGGVRVPGAELSTQQLRQPDSAEKGGYSGYSGYSGYGGESK